MSLPHHHRRSFAHLGAFPTLATNRLLGFVGSSLVGVFLPIFLFEFFDLSLAAVLLFFAIDFAVKIPFLVPAARFFSTRGLTRAMMIGTGGLVLFYWMLYLLDAGSRMSPYLLLAVAIAGAALNAALYWSPYHIDFAKFADKQKRGTQLGMFYGIQRLLSVAAPVAGAALIVRFGYHASFITGLLLTLASLIPLMFLPPHRVTYEFGYLESFRKLFSRNYRAMSFSMMAFGAENIVGAVVWPIFLFVVFGGSYLEVGAVASALVVVALIMEYIVGKETDRYSPGRVLKLGSWMNALGWLSKAFVETLSGVFTASTFHSVGAILMRTPLDTLTYEQAADSGHYIDEYTVLREMALSLGRAAMLLILIPLTVYFSIAASFVVAAIISLGVNWLAQYRASQTA
ncbi:MFS transporter [Candidatus Parcubacteria bacterium]|nr:MFS transporter [Candidatus Parcubacteria bacterium]